MKKALLTLGCLCSAVMLANSATLPDPYIRPNSYTWWFDGIYIVWADDLTQPYEIVVDNPVIKDGKTLLPQESVAQIKLMKDLTEEVEISNEVQLVEYQEDEYTSNYDNTQLAITLDMLEFDAGAYYSLYFPAGLVNIKLSDGTLVPNGEIYWGFTLLSQEPEGTLAMNVVPENNGVLVSLETITLNWYLEEEEYRDEVVGINFNELDTPVTVTHNGVAIEGVTVKASWSSRDAETPGWEGDVVTIDLGQEYTLPGEYIVSIPYGYMRINAQELGTQTSPSYTFTYQVFADPKPLGAPVVNPSDAVAVMELQTVTLTWNGYNLKEGAGSVTFTIDGEEAPEITTAIEGSTLTLTLPQKYEDAATYVITVPNGFVTSEDNDGYTYYNENVTLTYVIEPTEINPEVIDFTSAYPPNDALLEFLNNILITWDRAMSLNTANTENATLTLKNGTPMTLQGTITNGMLAFTFNDVATGVYNLYVPQGYVMAEADKALYVNREVKLTYAVDKNTAVTRLEADRHGMFTIYNSQGVKVMTTSDATEINSLANGIYIVNGKKVIIRK